MNIEVGDYIVGKDIFVVVAKNGWAVSRSYDLKCLTVNPGTITYFEPELGIEKCYEISDEIKSATRGYIRHLGRLVKKNDAKALRILFG